MQTRSENSPPSSALDRAAPALMAIGVTVLIAQLTWPVFPAVTAVSIITLGATSAMVARQRRPASPRTWLAVHFCVYASLYLLFIGAICDAAARGPRAGLTMAQVIDLGLSVGVMAFVARICVAALIGGGDAPAR